MRGGTRGSCNSCREKKRKCDLLSRLKEGIEICSRCARQETECYVGSRSESRTCKRQRLEYSALSSSPDERPTPSETIQPSTLPRQPFNGGSTNLESQEDFAALTERCDASLSLSPEDTASTYPLEEDLSTQFSTSRFGLSPETSVFLHRLFLGDPQSQSSNITPVGATLSVIGSFDSPAVESSRSTLVISKPSRLNIRETERIQKPSRDWLKHYTRYPSLPSATVILVIIARREILRHDYCRRSFSGMFLHSKGDFM